MLSRADIKMKVEREKIIFERYKRGYRGRNILGNAKTRYVTIDDISYVVSPVIKFIVDDYDSGIGSVELSHNEYMGYNLIETYYNKHDGNELDFSFAELQDVINMEVGDEIQSIILKTSNLKYTYLSGANLIDYTIIVDSDLIETVFNLRTFFKNNGDSINSIKFVNVPSKTIQVLLKKICNEGNQYNITFEESSKNKEYIKK